MAWAFLFMGLILMVAAFKDKQTELFDLLKDDFTGEGNFIYWVLAIAILSVVGTFKPLRPVTDAFLGLVILMIVVSTYRQGRDIFSEFRAQIREGTN